MIGEPQRALYGNQFGLTIPVFVHCGVGLWVPEVGGAVDPGSDAHDLVMSLYGGMSKGERNRIKTRVRSAMAAQAAIEGRFLGGRPPYGYVLADAGPHPNPAKAAAGQQLRRLEPDPKAAAVVQRIFAEILAGRGLYSIAEGLTAGGILSPSAHDPGRNRHRSSSGGAWSKSAIRAILRNPRYTGYQVWNRQARHEILIDVDDVALGHDTKMRWNKPSQWVWSEDPSHTAIISVETFDSVQDEFAGSQRAADVRTALRLAAVGTAEMAGYLSRWDRWYLKSYEAMARHRFGVTTLPVEPNVWGAFGYGRGTMSNRLRLMEKGAAWLDGSVTGNRPVIHGPFRADYRRRRMPKGADAMIVEGSSRRMLLPESSVDLVLTDPPYHDDLHYGELSLPLRVWAGLDTQALKDEALVNGWTSDSEYADLLRGVFAECKRILKGDGHLVFSYSNREPKAWVSLLAALQSAGFQVVGYAMVHSENESDPAKRNLRHCNLDMLIDAVPVSGLQLRRFRPANNGHDESAEVRFLRTVGWAVLRVGSLQGDWATRLSEKLRSTDFAAESKLAESRPKVNPRKA